MRLQCKRVAVKHPVEVFYGGNTTVAKSSRHLSQQLSVVAKKKFVTTFSNIFTVFWYPCLQQIMVVSKKKIAEKKDGQPLLTKSKSSSLAITQIQYNSCDSI